MDDIEKEFLSITLSLANKIKINNSDIETETSALNSILVSSHRFDDSFKETLQSIIDGVTKGNKDVTEKFINQISVISESDRIGYLGVIDYSCMPDKSTESLRRFVASGVEKNTTNYRFLHLLTRLSITVGDPDLIDKTLTKVQLS